MDRSLRSCYWRGREHGNRRAQARYGWNAVGEELGDLRGDRRGVHHVGHLEGCTVSCAGGRGKGID